MTNPLKKNSHKKVLDTANKQEFFSKIYPDHVMDHLEMKCLENKTLKSPRCIFMPGPEIVQTIIQANLKFAKKDTLEEHLLRFGVFSNQRWYMKN